MPSLRMLRLRPSDSFVCALPWEAHQVFPSTNGEGSLIILGRIPVAEGRSLLCDIKISLGLLHCERSGSLGLGEIYQYHPSECCAFDLRILTFAYSLREKPLGTSKQRI